VQLYVFDDVLQIYRKWRRDELQGIYLQYASNVDALYNLVWCKGYGYSPVVDAVQRDTPVGDALTENSVLTFAVAYGVVDSLWLNGTTCQLVTKAPYVYKVPLNLEQQAGLPSLKSGWYALLDWSYFAPKWETDDSIDKSMDLFFSFNHGVPETIYLLTPWHRCSSNLAKFAQFTSRLKTMYGVDTINCRGIK